MSNIYRDRTLNQVSEQDIDSNLRVAGWVENIRDHGGVSFSDLRDMYGVLQVVIRSLSRRVCGDCWGRMVQAKQP